jgi:hypothetical protein
VNYLWESGDVVSTAVPGKTAGVAAARVETEGSALVERA